MVFRSGLRQAIAASAISIASGSAALASGGTWDGTWSGMLNKTEPVSITVADGKVVGYTIRGFTPLAIRSAVVTSNRVSLEIGPDYHVSITRKGQRAAFGVAHGPLGNGTASLLRQ